MDKLIHSIFFSSFGYRNEHLAVGSDGHLCTNSIYAVVAAGITRSKEVEMFNLTGLPGCNV